MSLLELYLQKNKGKDWQDVLHNDKENMYLFEFTNNFRDLSKFEDGYITFKKLTEMTPAQMQAYVEESPEKAKSFISNMMRTKLFMSRDSKRVPTAKGMVYEKFLTEKLSDDDRWFINFLFVADSYFGLTSNYIFERTERVFAAWESAGYSIGQIYNTLIYLFNIRENTMEEYLRTEYMVMLTFLNDPDFLSQYRESSEFEKNEFHEHIVDNFSKGRYTCLITSKFSPTALTDCDTVLDDAKILFFAHYIKNSHPISLEDTVDLFAQVYTRFYKLNNKRVTNFIMMYEEVFRMTYLNLFSDMQDFYSGLRLDDKALASTKEQFDAKTLLEELKEPTDYTTTDSIELLIKVNSMFSANAKLSGEYKCELHKENHCKYFTSKESGHPYLEIHQIIPRDYAGEFSHSIERSSNYIALCPHCHRVIHNAADTERYHTLSQIYAKRKELLEADGIVPSNELLFAVYGIEQGKLKPGDNDFAKLLLEQAQPKLAPGKGKTETKSKKAKTTK